MENGFDLNFSRNNKSKHCRFKKHKNRINEDK